jgi:tripartite-type tricarboxylate transporter receptor subunit TctC
MKPKIGVALTPVSYKSTGPLLTDLAGNHIPLGIMAASTRCPSSRKRPFAPPGTPDPIIRRLNAAMKQASELPAIKKWFDESGLEVPMGSPEELTSFMRADIEKWVQLAKDNNLKIDNSGHERARAARTVATFF